jgi:hypothetical protein
VTYRSPRWATRSCWPPGTLIGSSSIFDGASQQSAATDFASGTDLSFGFRFRNAAGDIGVTTTPEPGTWALLGTGLLALGGVARRRRSRA